MEILLLLSNTSILGLLYQKLLDNERILTDLRNRVSDLEGIAVERRKRGDRRFTPLDRDVNIDESL